MNKNSPSFPSFVSSVSHEGGRKRNPAADSRAARPIVCLLLSLVLACTLLPLSPAPSAFADEGAASNAPDPAQTNAPSPAKTAEPAHGQDNSATHTNQQVVKVGYMQKEGVFARNEDGSFEGYTYDYLVSIAQFTGWKYEFIEAPGADDNEQASALINMLINGEVDIEGGMIYSQALANSFEYPQNSYGTAHTALFVPDTNSAITQTDLFTRDNVTVSILKSANKRRAELVYFFEQNGIELTLIDCEGTEEMYERVRTGEADAFLDIDLNKHEGFHTAVTFAGRPYFFAAPKGHRDVIDDIDETIDLINRSNPSLQDTLYDRYFMQTKSDYSLTESELAFAAAHETLRVGVVSEKAPIQSFNRATGTFEGVTKGVLDYLSSHAGFSFEIVKIDRSDDLAAAIREADVDMIAGVDNNNAVREQLGLSLSAPYLSSSKLLVYNKFVDPDNLENKTMAAPWEQAALSETKSGVILYDSVEACLEAVNEGKADYTYSTSYCVPYYISAGSLNNLLTLPSTSQVVETCFALVHPVEPELLQINNKSIRGLSSTELDSIVYDNSLIDQDEQISFFIRDHLLEVALGFITLLLVVIALLVLYLRTRVLAARRVREENRRFQKLYSLANEQFFEYSVKNDTLLFSRPNGGQNSMVPDDEGETDGSESYRLVRNARERLGKKLSPDLVDAFLSPRDTVTDAPFESENGQRHWLRIMSHFVTDDLGKPITVIGKITNIDDEMREKQDLSQRAHHDGLTGLLNWKTFQERAGRLLEEGRAGALLILDTDDFKLVNDTFGHLTGDIALQRTSEAITRAFRSNDMVGRLGGDEFAVCIAGPIGREELVERCSRIVGHAVTFPDQNGQMQSVTLSIGGVELPDGKGISYEAAYQQADRALYHAKADGKNRFFIECPDSKE